MTQKELQKLLADLKLKDATVRLTAVSGKKAIVNATTTLYTF